MGGNDHRFIRNLILSSVCLVIGTIWRQNILGGSVKNIKLILLVVVLGVALVACSSAPGTELPVSPSPTTQPPVVDAAVEGPPAPPTCVANPAPPTPSAEDLALYSPDPEVDWVRGPEDAPITIVEYADFQCPYCAVASQNLETLLAKYPDDVRLVYRHFPLASIHDKAILAVQGAEAAGRQGKEFFWTMHDALYKTQSVWSSLSSEDFSLWLIEMAGELGMDKTQFEADLYSEDISALAEAAWTDGQGLGIPGTPYIKINSLYDAQADPQMLTAYVEMIKLEKQQFTACPPMTVDPESTYRATVETSKGSFVIDLFPKTAPLAVNSFIYLAENGWFDGITFHRVLPGFVAQTGDPTGTGFGSPGYRFGNEITPDLVFDRAGLVAMANSGPDSNGSQFFITYDAAPTLDGGYTIFGEVVEGMDVVNSITPRDPQQGVDLPPGDPIISITIEKQ